jgi:predicted transcriptional regulator of viral defense system
MITKKSAIKMTRYAEQVVHKSSSAINEQIQLHAMIGMSEMEIFVDKKTAKKIINSLEKKGYYTRITEFSALENDCRLYVSWMSSI